MSAASGSYRLVAGVAHGRGFLERKRSWRRVTKGGGRRTGRFILISAGGEKGGVFVPKRTEPLGLESLDRSHGNLLYRRKS